MERLRGRFGLRARVTLGFTGAAFALSLMLCGLSYGLVRSYLVNQSRSSAVREAEANAITVRDGLGSTATVSALLASLQDSQGSPSLLYYGPVRDWFSSQPLVYTQSKLPEALVTRVTSGRAAHQAYRLDGSIKLVVGMPLPSTHALYFQVFTLDSLARTLRYLAYTLLVAGLATVVAGAAIGRGISAALLRPVGEVAGAAAAVAGGHLETRLPPLEDPDLDRLATSFNSMADALQARIERDARFASDVSHELRSPLTTLATSVGVLAARRDEMPERARAALDLITADVDRFRRLVEDLLEISRSDAGVTELHLEDVRLAELVMAAVAASDGPSVVLGKGAERITVSADKRRMERVIANLIENAARYGGGATRVTVEGGRTTARIAVEDAGPGVAPEERQKIFERFFRGSAAGRRRGAGQGSGLGLSLVAEHVRMHRGQVWVEDGPGGVGARFIVELPARKPAVFSREP